MRITRVRNKMNAVVLNILPFPNGSAATNRLLSYLVGMVDLGHSVEVLCLFPTENFNNVKNEKVISIGKNLKKYNAIDTGMFIISPYFFKVLEKSIKNGFCSITDSVKEMSKQGKMKAFESKGFWFDID